MPPSLGRSAARCGGRLRSPRRGAAARGSMNARGSGVSRGERDLPKCVEGFAKPGEGKSKSLGRKFKARGSEIQASFFRESGLFKGLRANPDCEPLFSATRRRRAWTCAWPQGWSRACFARAVPQSMPASIPAALAAFWGTKTNDSTGLENRKQKSRGTVRLSAVTEG